MALQRADFGPLLVLVAATMVASCGGGGGAGVGPPPGPVPTFTLNPASMLLGGLETTTCPAPPPPRTICGSGFNAFPANDSTTAAAVRFIAVAGFVGGYTVTADDPRIVSLLQPFPNQASGTMVFGVTPLAVGTTTVHVNAPNGATAALPVTVTSLTVVLDGTHLSPSASISATLGYAGGGGLGIVGGVRSTGLLSGGASYTVVNVPAYAAAGKVPPNTDLNNIVYVFDAANAVTVQVRDGGGGFISTTPLSLADGRANTVTVVLTPPP